MTLALGVVFWVCILVLGIWWVASNRGTPLGAPWLPAVLLFVAVVMLGIAEFGSLHLAK